MDGDEKPAKLEGAAVTKGTPWWFGFQTHWLYVVIAVVLIGGGIGLIVWEHHRNNELPGPAAVTLADTDLINKEANAAVANGDISEALNIYNQNIPNAANKTVQGELNGEAASIAYDANQYQTALKYALVWDADLPTADTSSMVAQIYQQLGNKTQAISYYQKAAREVPAHPISGYTGSYYQGIAQQLGGGGVQ
ncbi:MAG TPA: hypothetical protein VGS28_01290 [Candidatus Saccharimonadales bacterium]|nr:hypothetical protein [Candidatus Saccharimonadales bacterium]